MTNRLNKEFNRLKFNYDNEIAISKIETEVEKFRTLAFCRDVMKLIEELYILNIQYKARISLLKNLLKDKK